jgi:dihydroorotase
MFIDPHCHLRWREQQTDYVALAMRDCKACGIHTVMEMPNTNPPLTTSKTVDLRSESIWTCRFGVEHFINVGITTDPVQMREAIRLAMQKKHCRAVKLFLSHSTGNMGLLSCVDQLLFWEIVRQEGYRGVVMMHCEEEGEWHGAFDPFNPISHSYRQNPESEYVQVSQQLELAERTDFQGDFYVCHVSNPATLDLLSYERSRHAFRIFAEVTWHHMFLNTDDYAIHGNRVKMNPPLRSPSLQRLLLNKVLNGQANIIGSDHAPHSVEAKDSSNPPSGIPALPFWSKGVQLLSDLGAPRELIWKLTSWTARMLFDLPAEKYQEDTLPKYDPALWDAYGWNPFSRVDGSIPYPNAETKSVLQI